LPLSIAILYNIRAGKHRSAKIAGILSSALDLKGISYEVFGDPFPKDLSRFTTVFIIGGDGTLNHVINHVVGSMPPIALFKGGTGNDFATGLYGSASVEETLEIALHAAPRPVDAGLCNGRIFLNMFGAGFDGDVLKGMATIRRLGPFLGYYLAVIRTILFYREPVLEITVDQDPPIRKRVLLLLLNNAPTTGGGFRVSPRARIQDGVLDLVTVDPLPVLQRLRYLPVIRKGEHLDLPFVHHRRVNRLRILSDRPIQAQLDGERVEAREFDITMLPGRFRFLFPEPG
jgi:YegS/Rv2252/BmrU family lipid kinase